MKRFILFSHQDEPLGEISPNDILAIERREEINGEHSLEVTTIQVLENGWRVLYQDARGIWREYEVTGVDEEHSSGNRIVGTYYCTWSIQNDLSGVTVSKMPGVQTPVQAGVALAAALETQTRWTVGTVSSTATGGASMYDMSAWQAMSVLVENWPGELSTSFTVSNTTGKVTARKVDYYEKQGNQTAKRRFDFGADMKSIKRKIVDEPLYCRISPRGAGEQTESGGYGRKITIESVNNNKDYLEYQAMVDVAKIPNGNGGWQYPTVIIENSDCKTPSELKTWAQSVIEETLTPKVSYEIDVLQAAREGVDLQGVSLGDAVHAVDRKFGSSGLRTTGRVVSMTVDEITGKTTAVTIGYLEESLGKKLANTASMANAAYGKVNTLQTKLSTAEYIDELIERLNTEINVDGGYTYIIPGNGMRTYDAEVSDPLVGSEASKVVEIKGGSIRIASTKTAQGAWNWRSVFVSGLIATDVLSATNIITGSIEDAAHKTDPNTGNFWNLDTGEFRMAASSTIGGQTAAQIAAGAVDAQTQLSIFNKLTNNGQQQGIYLSNGLVYINGTYIQAGQIDASLITTGALEVKDANNDVLFRADISSTPKEVLVAGFHVLANALYNNLSSPSGSLPSGATNGVYVGTDGIVTAYKDPDTNEVMKLKLFNDALEGYQGNTLAGTIKPILKLYDTVSGDIIARGVTIDGGAICFNVDYIAVKDPNGNYVFTGINQSETKDFLIATGTNNWTADQEGNTPYEITVMEHYDDVACGLTVSRLVRNLVSRSFYSSTQVDSKLADKAPLASPEFTGTPKAPTATAGTNTQQLATTAFVKTALTNTFFLSNNNTVLDITF